MVGRPIRYGYRELPQRQRNARRWCRRYGQVGTEPDRRWPGAVTDLAVVKSDRHYLGYEQETSRNIYLRPNPESTNPLESQLPISSNIDDRTTHEVYMWGFAEAVRAGVGSVMCGYNR